MTKSDGGTEPPPQSAKQEALSHGLTGAWMLTQGAGGGREPQPLQTGASPQSRPTLDLTCAILPDLFIRMVFEGQPLGVVLQVTWNLYIRVHFCQSHFNKLFVLTSSFLTGIRQTSFIKDQTVNGFIFAVCMALWPLDSVLCVTGEPPKHCVSEQA